MKRFVAAWAAVVLLMFGNGRIALAHASLVRCSIKNNEIFTVKNAPMSIQAFFAERLDPAKSWINVFEGVADHGLINEKTKSVVNFQNPKEMTLKLPKLTKDKYYMVWYTHSAEDGHFAAGIVYFQVK